MIQYSNYYLILRISSEDSNIEDNVEAGVMDLDDVHYS